MAPPRSFRPSNRPSGPGKGPAKGRGGKRPSTPPAATPHGPILSLSIDRLGARGDGIAHADGQTVFVPFALPGETVQAQALSRSSDGVSTVLKGIEQPSEHRADPVCPHFTRCGGCVTQHMVREDESIWKRSLIVEALKHRGFEDADTLVSSTIALPAGSRRRAVFGYRRLAERVVVGFNERASHQIIPLDACPVLVPALSSLLVRLPALLAPVLPKGSQGDIMVVASDTGVDMMLDIPAIPDLAGREGLAAVADQLDLARLTVRIGKTPEPMVMRRQPVITLGNTRLPLPIGAFLQPSAEGQQALQDLVLAAVGDTTGAVADLFCGMGTFALPIAELGRQVTAYDLEAVQTAPLHTTGRVKAQARDLFRLPLIVDELKPFSTIVLDPPRAGAQQQCQELVRLPPGIGPQRVVMVSCSPATFSRDARILADGGYRLNSVTPVDQFVWSAHVELVAVFTR
ncbi:23S rRNA (uracil(1939)-C(5))-methyltransferase RlmD [Insolitispirillum peregrinum]|uniref:23S rRNA (uracil(1939)-C(5))-methyltransferase RlmD n=1 Tax=Insolitispirillum peregrinum TaxID=80876 RepID=UPI003620B2DE